MERERDRVRKRRGKLGRYRDGEKERFENNGKEAEIERVRERDRLKERMREEGKKR